MELQHLRGLADPDTAAENRIGTMILFAKYISEGARDRGFRVETVDGTKTPEEVARTVAEHFGIIGGGLE